MRSITMLARELAEAHAVALVSCAYLDKLKRADPPAGLAEEHGRMLRLAERHAALSVARDKRVEHTLATMWAGVEKTGHDIIERTRAGLPTETTEVILLEMLGDEDVPRDRLSETEHAYLVTLLRVRETRGDVGAVEALSAAHNGLLGHRRAA
jgi:hypothetical protein